VSIPQPIIDRIEVEYGDITGFRAVAGGDICSAFVVKLDTGISVFIKFITHPKSDFLESEANGLHALRLADSPLRIPEVHGVYHFDLNLQCLIMEYLVSMNPDKKDWVMLGEGLASLHSNTSTHFGWEQPNYIGKLDQANDKTDNWPRFFGEHRLEPQLKLGLKKGVFGSAFAKNMESIIRHIDMLLPKTPPQLIHGDLWSSNILFTEDGPALIDPSVSYGSGEADIAMSRLFSGFSTPFYDAYYALAGKIPGFENRIQLLQLYWLMVHANLFGGNYIDQCAHIAHRYV